MSSKGGTVFTFRLPVGEAARPLVSHQLRHWSYCSSCMSGAYSKLYYCCKLSVGVALNVLFTTNGMYVKNSTHI